MTELLPCPFCGSCNIDVEIDGPSWSAICECDAEGPWAHDKDIAVAAWNRRAAPASPESLSTTQEDGT